LRGLAETPWSNLSHDQRSKLLANRSSSKVSKPGSKKRHAQHESKLPHGLFGLDAYNVLEKTRGPKIRTTSQGGQRPFTRKQANSVQTSQGRLKLLPETAKLTDESLQASQTGASRSEAASTATSAPFPSTIPLALVDDIRESSADNVVQEGVSLKSAGSVGNEPKRRKVQNGAGKFCNPTKETKVLKVLRSGASALKVEKDVNRILKRKVDRLETIQVSITSVDIALKREERDDVEVFLEAREVCRDAGAKDMLLLLARAVQRDSLMLSSTLSEYLQYVAENLNEEAQLNGDSRRA
jgi:hypothetical protein